MRSFAILSLASAAAAQIRGFNYGATNNDGSVRVQQDFENEFNRAKSLQGTSGFTSGRLYTMIQGNTADTVTAAIPAAINTKTSLLLGLWASAGQDAFNNEITALKNAISQYGSAFTSLIEGISVGSEDLYRVTPTGIENNSGAGSTPDALVSYIGQVRSAIANTPASGAKVGHVDTWTAWTNGSNVAVINAVDWLGVDGYPYYQTVNENSIDNAANLFFESYNATVGVAQGKPVWVTETGYPVSGPTSGQAVASDANAETYWQEVACRLLGSVNTWWYTLYDPQASGAVSFGLVGPNLDSEPLYNLACSGQPTSASSSASTPSSTAVAPTQPTTKPAETASSIVTTPEKESSAPTTAPTTAPAVSAPAVSAPAVGSGETKTDYQTTLITITSCSGGCPKPTSVTVPASSAAPPPPAQSSPSSGSGSGKSCPTNLSGTYECPHLIVPVSSSSPNTAYGTSYNGKLSPTESSIFNFDIPASYAGKTCSLVFLFPEQKDLETSSFTFNGKGGITVEELTGPATEQTTYANAPAKSGLSQTISSVAPGNSYLVFSHECAAGERKAFEFESTGGLELEFFQDYNPSPIGAYITVC
ncbi:glycoside hydrolase family 17 protein [Zasmidium cellare ATCC 36951]|uniref:Glycoside hydrolase family 17 protein n=1 Tax=Zasmidium cellare ATCC 36951 TaxID=1080233 RepID=A0A6A6CRY3_ZASCE|nr:glycoside hydrolase family 17 protein [Zasmidium cellare ATCC 36951]KAF2168938.1 glycoside hydrolase family 17 protein [Zasmidium cellare ATCC 36951]